MPEESDELILSRIQHLARSSEAQREEVLALTAILQKRHCTPRAGLVRQLCSALGGDDCVDSHLVLEVLGELLAPEGVARIHRHYDPRRGEFRAYLYRLAHTEVRKRAGRERRRRSKFVLRNAVAVERCAAPVCAGVAEGQKEGAEGGQLRAALARLPELDRLYFALKYLNPVDQEQPDGTLRRVYQKRSDAEIAAHIGVPTRTVNHRVNRAKKRLRRVLMEMERAVVPARQERGRG